MDRYIDTGWQELLGMAGRRGVKCNYVGLGKGGLCGAEKVLCFDCGASHADLHRIK